VAAQRSRDPKGRFTSRVAPSITSLSREAAFGGKAVNLSDKEEKVTPTTTFSTLTTMYKNHPIVRAAIDKIAKSCVANGYQFMPRYVEDDINEATAKNLNDIFSRSRANYLLRQTYTDLLIYGDAYWFITNTRDGVPFSFIRQHPSTVSVVIDKETREVTGYITRDATGNEMQFAPEEFVHFRIYDPDNDLYGLSPLQSLQTTVAQDLFASQFNLAFFENNAQTGVVFNMQNASKEEVERNREFLKKEYVGTINAHKPLILEGDVKVQNSVSSPADMQFIEGRNKLTQEILAVFDLPYTKLGGAMESANRSQSEENDKSFRTETVIPLQTIVEEVVNEDLIFFIMSIEDTLFAHKDVDERSEADKMTLWGEALERGVYTLNEVRAKLGLKAIPGGEEAYINTSTGLVPLSAVKTLSDLMIEGKEVQNKNMKEAPKVGAAPPGNPNTPSGKSQPPSKTRPQPK
jgi:HK97 family phage portal protein